MLVGVSYRRVDIVRHVEEASHLLQGRGQWISVTVCCGWHATRRT
jgi:hypothetical protein